jgi:hypothetical protein
MADICEFATWGPDGSLQIRKWVPLEDFEVMRGTLSLAEEGLANYAQENERLCGDLSLAKRALEDLARENEQLRQTFAYRLRELYQAKWLIRNGEKHFGSLWRDATAEDIRAIAERSYEPQTCRTPEEG